MGCLKYSTHVTKLLLRPPAFPFKLSQLMGRLLSVVLLFVCGPALAGEAPGAATKWGVGVNYVGGQARYFFKPKWAGELRYQTATVGGGAIYTTSQVIGLRGYRFFETGTSYRFYLGGEFAAVNSSEKQEGIFYKAGGTAFGAFGGGEYFFSRRWAVSLDAGPYMFSIKERLFGGRDASFDFIANGCVNYYFF